ncbi:MAG: 3-deoxy-manno-octulosonate cytidylyltransferase [Elusimicrobiales bacterium]|nr:3-deoxy-manno-octulosonate cytidylyltransferase [Elusimicrobiales bacterium]
MKICAVIPARYSSTRFPGKVIYTLCGKPVVIWVWERVKKIRELSFCYIATDSEKVYEVCKKYNAPVIMTSSNHQSGTDRVWEVASKVNADIYINVQGDEPFIKEECITLPLRLILKEKEFDITSAASIIKDINQINDINVVKVVFENKKAIYFSRLPVPYHFVSNNLNENSEVFYYRHIGVYVYRKKSLEKFVKAQKSKIELLERLEQLRALAIGLKIGIELVDYDAPAIDVPSDIKLAEKYFRENLE